MRSSLRTIIIADVYILTFFCPVSLAVPSSHPGVSLVLFTHTLVPSPFSASPGPLFFFALASEHGDLSGPCRARFGAYLAGSGTNVKAACLRTF